MARIVDAIGRVRGGALSCVEAAALLGLWERHFRRLRDAYREGGAEAIIDKRRGRPAPNKVAAAIADWVAEQYRTNYFDFTAKHFHEALKKDGFRYGYTWTKSVLYLRGLLKPAKARGPHRRKRPRSPLPGMLVFQDGSTHDWFLVRGAPCDLIETHGLFSCFYTDRGSHYFHTPKAGEKVDKERPTQVGRALAQLGIAHIPSYSPEGRGRMERVFGTLQRRLTQKPPLAWFGELSAANAWRSSAFRPWFPARFPIKP